MLYLFLELKSSNRIKTSFKKASNVIPIADTFISNGVYAIADGATMLNKKTICRESSSTKRMNFSGILKIIMKTNW